MVTARLPNLPDGEESIAAVQAKRPGLMGTIIPKKIVAEGYGDRHIVVGSDEERLPSSVIQNIATIYTIFYHSAPMLYD